jgi:hypothetical protein
VDKHRNVDMHCYGVANFVFVFSAMIFYSTWYLGAATSTSMSYEVGTLRTQRDLGLAVGLRVLILECANMPP